MWSWFWSITRITGWRTVSRFRARAPRAVRWSFSLSRKEKSRVHKAHVSTPCETQEAGARFPQADGDAGRPDGTSGTTLARA